MKKIAKLLIILLLFSLPGQSQNLITNNWLFKTGDNLAWKETSFTPADWKTIQSGKPWEDQGFIGYDGYGWYIQKTTIPANLKKKAVEFGGLNLFLGTIDDADQIYFNGKLIGQTGKLPPNYEGAYNKIRSFDINVQEVNWDKENLIAVRVFDNGGNGGIMGTEISLKVKGIESFFTIDGIFSKQDHIFLKGEKVNLKIELENSSKYFVNGVLNYRLINDFSDTIAVWKEQIKIPSKKNKLAVVDKGTLPPGFYTLHTSFESELVTVSKSFCFGVNPEEIISPTNRPDDFENYWARARRELAAVEPQFKLIKMDSLCTSTKDVYLVEMRSLYNVLIRGWYSKPKADGKYPAILHVQGYSTDAQMSWGYGGEDMAVFVLNIRGHGNSRDEVNPGFPGYLINNLKDPERYIYRAAYMDCIRAVDFLCSREEVDKRYIVVEGGSQGGALSFATAALDNERISLCIPSVPFLSDFQDYFKIAYWPANEFINYEKENKGFGWGGIFKTLSYIDIKNLAPWIKCPVYMSIGLRDNVCPPHINFAAYNQLNVPKRYHVFPEAGHGLPAECNDLKYKWMKEQLDMLKKQ